MKQDPHKEADHTGTIMRERDGGWLPTLHAIEHRVQKIDIDGTTVRIDWYRPACQRAWVESRHVRLYDYRYRGGIGVDRPCKSPACQRQFREVLVG